MIWLEVRTMSEADSIDHEWETPSQAMTDDEPKSSTSPVVWSVNAEGKEVIELTHAELVERVRDGRLPVTTFLWRDGMEDWKALDRFPEFESLVAEARAHDSGLRPRPEELADEDSVGPDTTPTHIGARLARPDSGLAPKAAASVPQDASTDQEETAVMGKDVAFLAVYERPVATLEFDSVAEEADDDAGPSSEDLTPSRPLRPKSGPPPRRSEPPRPGARKTEPRLPPLPAPRRAVHRSELPPKPAPVVAKEKLAVEPVALKSAPLNEKPAIVSAEPVLSPISPPAADAEALGADEVAPAPAPPLPPSTPSPAEQLVPPPPASVVGPPRPAIATLPPIILREAPISASELVAAPAPARLDESTLVLGRRRTHRWVPLRAAILSAFGSACLASVLTWAIVRPARSVRPTPATVEVAKAAPALTMPEPKQALAPVEPAPPEPAAVQAPGVAAASDAEGSAPAGVLAKTAASEPSSTRRKAATARGAEPSSDRPTTEADGAKNQELPPRATLESGLGEATTPASVSARETPAQSARSGWPSSPGF
jgi:hypothetical protein